MKKTKNSVACIAMVLTLGACGRSGTSGNSSGIGRTSIPTLQSYSGTGGNCVLQGPRSRVCIEFSYSGILSSDPSGPAMLNARTTCDKLADPSRGATTTFTPNNKCERDAAFGYCTSNTTQTLVSESYSFNEAVVFQPPVTPSEARNWCTNEYMGTYSTAAP